ncbi:Interferon induced protein 44 [Mactra antiquata]
MTGKLKDEDMAQLETWIGKGSKQFTLLYAITRDGCNPNTFHQLCDNKGPTVTVLYNQQGSVYGGYTNINWSGNVGHKTDAGAFLFQLKFDNKKTLSKFPSNGNGNDMYSRQNYGPTFGGGHDLHTFSGNIGNSGGYFQLNGYLTIGTGYTNTIGINMNNINNGNMNVTELEVYQVTDGKRQKATPTPWRKTPAWNDKFLDGLIEDITTFKPFPDLDISEARILMLGPVGAGKSSFYNTINSIFRGRITQKAGSGSAEQSLTTAYTPYFVRERSGGTLNFRICDTRGLEDSQGIDVIECNYLLDGHVPEYYQFNPATPITPNTNGFISKPTLEEKIHCVVFVLDSTTVEVLPDKIIQKMKSFQTLMNQKGIPQAILLTKIDKLCENVEKNTAEVFTSGVVEENVAKVSQLLGLPRGNVLPVKNYENEMQLDKGISILSLLSLRQILNFAEDYLESLLDKMAASSKRRGMKEKSKEKK